MGPEIGIIDEVKCKHPKGISMDFKPLGPSSLSSAPAPLTGPPKSAPVNGSAPIQTPASASKVTARDQIQQAAVPPGQAVNSLAFVEDTSAKAPPTREDLAWFDAMDTKINRMGYQPNASEALRFNEIESYLAASDDAATTGPPSRAEVNWTLELEDMVNRGYEPNAEELKHYQQIAVRLFIADQTPSIPDYKTVSPEELAWAKNLEEKITHPPYGIKYEASTEEKEKYQDIYNRFQAEKAEQKQQTPPSPEDLKWAQDLADEITKKGHKATPEEVTRYTEIYNRHQATSNLDLGRPLTSEDVQWHQELTEKMKKGYQPSAAELDRAGKIVEILYINDPSLINPHDAPVAQHERDWALRLRTQAEAGIPPSPEELARYEEIYNRYAAPTH